MNFGELKGGSSGPKFSSGSISGATGSIFDILRNKLFQYHVT